MTMQCYVYKGERKEDHYLYLPETFDEDQTHLPEAVLGLLGDLHLVTEFDLHERKKLAQADPVQVIVDIETQGFYLQMPNQDQQELEDQYFN